MEQVNIIKSYLAAVNDLYRQQVTTEHSFRGALEALLGQLTGLVVVNEAKHIGCGAPDLTLLDKNSVSIGYVEAKDIGKNLNDKSYKEQLARYKKALDNLIITDYLTFQFFKGEELVEETIIGQVENGKIVPIANSFNRFIELVKDFSRYNGKAIKTSAQLAEFMAAKTQLLAEAIQKTLYTSNASSLHGQLRGFQAVLLPDITPAQFADMYAQTVAYGLFVARLVGANDHSSLHFTREKAAKLIPVSNPFLKQLFKYVSDDDNIDTNIKWIVDSLAEMFNHAAIEAIHREFTSKDKDPFLHFYEDFLTKYDKKLKNARGAYYTPQAVVTFIVNAVDEILKADFNLPKGLADNTKVTVNGKEYHKVQILDPATGTGTFLAEVLRKIHKAYEGNEGIWSRDVKEHILKRLNGFEVMMSPYTMAHLKLEMLLNEFAAGAGANGHSPLPYNSPLPADRLQIYLTDSLETPKGNVPQLPFAQWLSNEAAEAEKIKNEMPVMVVLGNPPYSGESSNKGEWILRLMEDYKKEPVGGRLQEKNPKWLNDDYVKFIRFGQHFIEKNGEGILAYISNHSFLDNPTFRGMRYNLLQTFDKIYVLDLHGNAKKKECAPDGSKDDNVFDIQQGVSINIFVRAKDKKGEESAKVWHYDLYGRRQEKYNFLLENNLQTVPWQQLAPVAPSYFFVPKDASLLKEYEQGFLITELFPVNSVGIVTARDNFTIHQTKEGVINTIKDFLTLDDETARTNFDLGHDTRDWSVSGARKDLTPNPDFDNITKINYRPFDIRYTYYTGHSKGFHCMPRGDVMQHFIKGENIALAVTRQTKIQSWQHAIVTNNIVPALFVEIKDNCNVFPLYLYHDHFGQTEKAVNMNEVIVKKLNAKPEQIFDYIYAVLHSPAYRERYKEFLKIDFPRIPYPKDAGQFEQLAALGAQLRQLHLLENIEVPTRFANYPIAGSDRIENSFTEKSGDYRDGKVWINDTQYFDNVPAAAWSFYIGGYQPAQKWLKDRRGRTLEDIAHYRKIIYALAETDRIMGEIGKWL